MNFLGHLYFSNNDISIMQPNLFGDFVKGKDLSMYPNKIQEGITLHRKIDQYVDHHPAVIELLPELYEPLPKVAGIAVDLFFDHLLAKNWDQFSTIQLDEFIHQFYNSIDPSTEFYTPHFQLVLSKMQERNWLYHYQYLDGLNKSCLGVSRRLSFPNKLIDGVKVFEQHKTRIEEAFTIYMKDAQLFFSLSR